MTAGQWFSALAEHSSHMRSLKKKCPAKCQHSSLANMCPLPQRQMSFSFPLDIGPKPLRIVLPRGSWWAQHTRHTRELFWYVQWREFPMRPASLQPWPLREYTRLLRVGKFHPSGSLPSRSKPSLASEKPTPTPKLHYPQVSRNLHVAAPNLVCSSVLSHLF